MMGFGTVIASIISVAILLLTFYVCSYGGFYMADLLANSVIEMQENKDEILKFCMKQLPLEALRYIYGLKMWGLRKYLLV